MAYKLILISAIAFLVTYVMIPIARKVFVDFDIVDRPGKRKVHNKIVPYGGGVAIFIGFMIALLLYKDCAVQISGFLISISLITLLGIFDDKYNLNPFVKLISQSLIAIYIINLGVYIDVEKIFDGRLNDFAYLSYPLTYFWIVGVTNAINIIDGLDGLAAGVSVISALTVATVSLLTGEPVVGAMALFLAAATAGFLPENFKTKIFMGDSGSMLLGFSLAVLSIMASVKLAASFSLLVPIMILAIPIFDTAFAILRRFKNRKSIFVGDSRHLHHRLIDMGFSARQTVLGAYAISVIFGILAVVATQTSHRIGYIIFGFSLIFIIIVGSTIVFFHRKMRPVK